MRRDQVVWEGLVSLRFEVLLELTSHQQYNGIVYSTDQRGDVCWQTMLSILLSFGLGTRGQETKYNEPEHKEKIPKPMIPFSTYDKAFRTALLPAARKRTESPLKTTTTSLPSRNCCSINSTAS